MFWQFRATVSPKCRMATVKFIQIHLAEQSTLHTEFTETGILPFNQWWSVTKYNYFVTVLKYIFQVSVLYWSSFILSNFYFYFTTFQSIRSYFLLHYISLNISLLTWYITCSETQKRCLIHEQTDSFQWTCSIGSQITANDSFTNCNDTIAAVLESKTHWFKWSV